MIEGSASAIINVLFEPIEENDIEKFLRASDLLDLTNWYCYALTGGLGLVWCCYWHSEDSWNFCCSTFFLLFHLGVILFKIFVWWIYLTLIFHEIEIEETFTRFGLWSLVTRCCRCSLKAICRHENDNKKLAFISLSAFWVSNCLVDGDKRVDRLILVKSILSQAR